MTTTTSSNPREDPKIRERKSGADLFIGLQAKERLGKK